MNDRSRPGKGGSENQAAAKQLDASILPRTADMPPFQAMPPLTGDEYAALKADIQANGVLVPITVDQHGMIIDGHHRQQIAAELRIPCPRVVQDFTDDEKRHDLALALNLKRRHLTREQFRELIAAECERTPDASDREIGRRLGCSHHTVATVRRPSVQGHPRSGQIAHPKGHT
jgi:ParB-like chromosome segregation protein Spo0J